MYFSYSETLSDADLVTQQSSYVVGEQLSVDEVPRSSMIRLQVLEMGCVFVKKYRIPQCQFFFSASKDRRVPKKSSENETHACMSDLQDRSRQYQGSDVHQSFEVCPYRFFEVCPHHLLCLSAVYIGTDKVPSFKSVLFSLWSLFFSKSKFVWIFHRPLCPGGFPV